MPDLDQIKQGEQELRTSAGGSPGVGRAIPRAARLPRPRQPCCAAVARRRGPGADRKAVELALAGDPAALQLRLERIVGPYRERAVEFTMPPIRNAADLGGPRVKADPNGGREDQIVALVPRVHTRPKNRPVRDV
jgi:hypothetical protein